MVRHASDVLSLLLEGGRTIVAGRLAGAFRNIRRDRIARVPLDRYSTGKARRLYGCFGKRERGTGHRAVCNVSWAPCFRQFRRQASTTGT